MRRRPCDARGACRQTACVLGLLSAPKIQKIGKKMPRMKKPRAAVAQRRHPQRDDQDHVQNHGQAPERVPHVTLLYLVVARVSPELARQDIIRCELRPSPTRAADFGQRPA